MLSSNPQLRPTYVQKVDSLPQAEKWRSVVMTELSVRLTRIQDPSLSPEQLREINDEINKLFREKRAWEHHIRTLGGSDHSASSSLQATGLLARNHATKGYRYFGRAKELPEAQHMELVEPKLPKERHLRLSYYGYEPTNEVFSEQDIQGIERLREKRRNRGNEEKEGNRGNEEKERNTERGNEEKENEEKDTEIASDKIASEDGDHKKRHHDEIDNHIYGSESVLLEYEKARSGELLQALSGEPRHTVEIPSGFPDGEEVKRWVLEKRKSELRRSLGNV